MSGKLSAEPGAISHRLTDYPIVEQYDYLFKKLKSTPQDPIHHGEGDVYTHTEMVLNALLNLPEFKELAAYEQEVLIFVTLFHDIAKPDTMTINEEGRITNPKHATTGAHVVRKILDTEGYSFQFISAVHYTVLFHGYPFWLFEKENSLKTVITTSLLSNNKWLYIFAKADLLGRISGDAEEMHYKLELFKEYCLDQGCYDQPKIFHSEFDRFHYFNVDDSYPDTQIYHQFEYDIYMMSGLPASGKDTYIDANFRLELPIISLDELREKMGISPTDNQGRVIQAAKELSREYCRKKQSFVWNATNISQSTRETLVSMWMPYNPKIHIVFMFVNIDKALANNTHREKEDKISNSKIITMFEKIRYPTILECHELHVIS